MKTTIFVLCLLWTAAAFGQSAYNVATMASTFQVTSHPEHASPHALAQEQSLLEGPGSGFVFAQGERPLWEFAPKGQEVPLGDIARAFREKRDTTKKARFIRED